MKKQIDWTKPIETTSGHPAKVISENFRTRIGLVGHLVQIERPPRPDRDWPAHDEVVFSDENGVVVGDTPSFRNRMTKREGWVRITGSSMDCTIYADRQSAAPGDVEDAIIARIEWEE